MSIYKIDLLLSTTIIFSFLIFLLSNERILFEQLPTLNNWPLAAFSPRTVWNILVTI